MSETLNLKVARVEVETDQIISVRLESEPGRPLPTFEAGAHIDVHLPNGVTRQYSLVNDPSEADHYLLGVLRVKESRGGSSWIHSRIAEGMTLSCGVPRNTFPLVAAAHHLFIAGGIGVTPLLSMAAHLHRTGGDFSLRYCTRRPEDTAFIRRINRSGWSHRVMLTHDAGDPERGIDLRKLLAEASPETHLYCCGPVGLMNAVRDASAHWPSGTVHFEWFSPDLARLGRFENHQFTCVLARSKREVVVPANRTIVEVLREHSIQVDTLCAEGLCGTCIIGVIEGEPDHRDSIPTQEERASNRLITVCCSRAKGRRIVLDL